MKRDRRDRDRESVLYLRLEPVLARQLATLERLQAACDERAGLARRRTRQELVLELLARRLPLELVDLFDVVVPPSPPATGVIASRAARRASPRRSR